MTFRVVERASRDRLGEGPTWVPSRAELVWVDICGHCVHRLHLPTGSVTSLPLSEPVGWVLPRATASTFIAGLKSGFAVVDLDSGEVRSIGDPEPDRGNNRLNDAKVDPQGRIWAGTKSDADEPGSGALYRLDADFSWSRHDHGYGVTNGPTFSPDGTTLYHTDSAARTIFAFNLREDGSVTDKRVWLRFEDEWGYPDGMTTDADGCIWVAHWGGARVSRFSPSGKLLRSIELPATNITSCAFAGEKLDRMFVTSSTLGCEDEPLAGALFEISPDTVGLNPKSFAG